MGNNFCIRLKHENEILSNEITEKMKSMEKEKSEFIESHMTERRNEIAQLKEHHRSNELVQFVSSFLWAGFCYYQFSYSTNCWCL